MPLPDGPRDNYSVRGGTLPPRLSAEDAGDKGDVMPQIGFELRGEASKRHRTRPKWKWKRRAVA